MNDCVQPFTDLLPEIVLYFEQEARNTAIRVSERNKLQEFYDELVDPILSLLPKRMPTTFSEHQRPATEERP